MKSLLLTFACLIALALPAAAADSTPAAGSSGKLRHVVAFKFKPDASAEKIQQLLAAFKALEKKIPQIKAFETGTNVSPEGLDKGFTHCWILTFTSDKDRDAYLVHPDHKAFGGMVGPLVDDVFVLDFWGQ